MDSTTPLAHRLIREATAISRTADEFISEADFFKAFPTDQYEIYTLTQLKDYILGVGKAIEKGEDGSLDLLEKAKKDLSHLQRKIVTTKQGHKMTVWVKTGEEKKEEDTFNPNGIMQKWPKLSEEERAAGLSKIEPYKDKLSHINRILFDREMAKVKPESKTEVKPKPAPVEPKKEEAAPKKELKSVLTDKDFEKETVESLRGHIRHFEKLKEEARSVPEIDAYNRSIKIFREQLRKKKEAAKPVEEPKPTEKTWAEKMREKHSGKSKEDKKLEAALAADVKAEAKKSGITEEEAKKKIVERRGGGNKDTLDTSKLPSWAADGILILNKDAKEGVKTVVHADFSKVPTQGSFSYGKGMGLKEQALENAKAFAQELMVAAKKVGVAKEMDKDHFSYSRLSDPFFGQILHGIPKTALKAFEGGMDSLTPEAVTVFDSVYGGGTYQRLKVLKKYRDLTVSPFVGGAWDRPTPLTFEKMILLTLAGKSKKEEPAPEPKKAEKMIEALKKPTPEPKKETPKAAEPAKPATPEDKKAATLARLAAGRQKYADMIAKLKAEGKPLPERTMKSKVPKTPEKIAEHVKTVLKGMMPTAGRYSDEDLTPDFTKWGAYLPTADRGPRTDHGGGNDGDGWMSDAQIRKAAKPYYEKWKPRMDEMQKALRKAGYKKAEVRMDYGEKGHVAIQISYNFDKK